MSGSKSRYIPALDGLRAFAVLAVIAYHMHLPWAPGGLLGVTVFFVLSGYLITSLLLIEHDKTRTINLPQFWLRRVRRLVPAIVFVIVATIVLCTIFNHALLTKMRPDIAPSLLFFNNWWQIFHNVSYFDALGAPSPLAHYWSLAIEEQFYLVWPIALLVFLKLGVKKTTLRNATLIVAGLSAIEMVLLFSPTADPSRVYYGTDTRAFSLLIGAYLAFVWPSHKLGARRAIRLTKRTRALLDAIGGLALVGLLLMIMFSNGFSPFLYNGGLVLCSVLTAIVIAVIVHPASIIGRIAGLAPFVWVGKRSYGIYLWHYPLLLLMNPDPRIETPWWLYLVQLAVVFACAAFSYRFIEDPIRHGALTRLIKQVKEGAVSFPRWLGTHALPAMGTGVVIAVAVGGLMFVPPTSALEGGDLLKQAEDQQNQGVSAEPTPPSESQPAPPSEGQPTPPSEASAAKPKLDVLMIGDSVSVRAVPYFDKAFPHGAIDAAVNRQLYAGQEVYDSYKAQDVVGKLVVIALGTNGVAAKDQLDALIADIGSDKQIWLVNTRSPRDWVQATNNELADAAKRHDNVHLIDWYAASEGRGDLFDGDGTHLTDEGAQVYVNLISAALANQLPQHPEDANPQAEAPSSAAPSASGEPSTPSEGEAPA